MTSTENPHYKVSAKGFMSYWEAVEEQKEIDKTERTGDSIGWGWYNKKGNRVQGTQLS